MKFNYDLNYKEIDFRENPECYQIGKGEQGVLLVEPYKSEIVPYWRFRTPEIAKESAEKIYKLFLEYKKQNDFVGMDMARKFLQMGFTRSRRYAHHKSGRKWDETRTAILPNQFDEEKAKSAALFYKKYLQIRNDPFYTTAKKRHQETYET